MELRVKLGKESGTVKEFPRLPLDELQEGNAVDLFEDNAEATVPLEQFVSFWRRKTRRAD